MHDLDRFFNPRSIAVIGASRTPGKIGYTILENIKMSFNGKIYPINPNTEEIMGLKCYPSVKEIKEPIDMAIIAVNAKIVPKVLEECGKKKISSVIIISSGFSEINKKEIEDELKIIIKKYKIRVLGPNCIGIYKKGLDMFFMPRDRLKRPSEGYIGVITQSGAFGSAILDLCSFYGIGVSKFVSIGNKIDINEIELLEYLGKDPATRAIAIYLESTSDGARFLKVAKEVVKNKPIVVLKAGKTRKGSEAVMSHTGALAGEYEVYQAAFKQAGIIEASDTEELFDFANALAKQPPLKDNKIAIITDGGGFGVVATDFAAMHGLELPQFSNETINKIKAAVPEHVPIKNPLDVTGDATTERYAAVLDAVMADKEISGIVIIVLLQIPTLDEKVIEVIAEKKSYGKPITVCMTGGSWTIEHMRTLEQKGIPVYLIPERAVSAMAALYQYGKIRAAQAEKAK